MTAYYNENDPANVKWLEDLINAGLIQDGRIDSRSIADVKATDLIPYAQCHFFAGISGWSRALRLAGVPDDEPLWTGSPPCQPFSVAGAGKAGRDSRHLFPVWRRLIRECRPSRVFGEQVASKVAREWWLPRVFAYLEILGYRADGADLCAASVGAPHIRQRLWWVADATEPERGWGGIQRSIEGIKKNDQRSSNKSFGDCPVDRLADAEHAERRSLSQGRDDIDGDDAGRQEAAGRPSACGEVGGVGNSPRNDQRRASVAGIDRAGESAGGSGGFWSDFDLVPCADGKSRRVKSRVQCLAHGVSGRMAICRPVEFAESALQGETETHWYSRVAALRGFGNAIVPQVAAEFIAAYFETNLAAGE